MASRAFRTLVELCRPMLLDATAAQPATDAAIGRSLGVTRQRVQADIDLLCAELDVDPSPAPTRSHRLATEAIRRGVVTLQDLRRHDGDDGDGLVGAFVP